VDSGAEQEVWVREQRVFNALARLRRDPRDREAAKALGESGLAGAAAFLDPGGGTPEWAAAAAIARLKLGDDSVLQVVLNELRTNAGRMRAEAAEALSARTEPAVLDAFRPFLADDQLISLRLSAALALGPSAGDAAVAALERYGLTTDDPDVYARAAAMLLERGSAKAVDSLARGDNPLARGREQWKALELLAKSPRPEATDRLEALAVEGGNATWTAALLMLRHHKDRAHRALGEALKKDVYDDDTRYNLILRLSPGEHPEVAPIVAEIGNKRLGAAEDDIADTSLRLLLADACDACGRGPEARKHLDIYAGLFPDTAFFCNNAAWFMAIGKTPEVADGAAAVPLAVRAVTAEPDSALYWDTLAEAFREAGAYREATLAAAKALELAPLDGEACDVPYCEKQLAKMAGLERGQGSALIR
jgi:tetratricopeptide (TPR) repeat protein